MNRMGVEKKRRERTERDRERMALRGGYGSVGGPRRGITWKKKGIILQRKSCNGVVFLCGSDRLNPTRDKKQAECIDK